MTRRDVLNRFFIFFTLTVFSFVNVGMAIYTHSCEINGTETSFFLAKEDPCKEVHVAKHLRVVPIKKLRKRNKRIQPATNKKKKILLTSINRVVQLRQIILPWILTRMLKKQQLMLFYCQMLFFLLSIILPILFGLFLQKFICSWVIHHHHLSIKGGIYNPYIRFI